MSFFQSDGYAFDRLPDDFEVTHDCVLGLSVGKEALLSCRGIVHNVVNEGKHWGRCVTLPFTLLRERPGTVKRDGRGLIWSIWSVWSVWFIWFVSFNQTNQTD